MFTKLWSKLILLHLIIQCLTFHPVFCDGNEDELDLDLRYSETISETTVIETGKGFDQNWNKVPWGYSAAELAILHSHEVIIHGVMAKYEQVLERRLQNVRQYLEDYKESVPKDDGPFWKAPQTSQEAGVIIAGHPFMAYRLTRRFGKHLNWIERSLKYDEGVAERLKEMRGEAVWPVQRDVDFAIDSILKMQYTYDFETLPFSSGTVHDVNLKAGLSKLQMVEIGEKAVHLGQFALGVEWLKAGRKKAEESLTDKPFNDIELARFMKEATKHHDDEFDAAEADDLTLFEKKINGLKKLPKKRRSMFKGFNPLGLDEYNVHLRYNILCLGVMMTDTFQSNGLYCWLDNYSHPYFAIQPLRTELHSFDPYLVQVHDLISNSMLKELLNSARNNEKLLSTRPDARDNYPVAYLDEERKRYKKFRHLERIAELVTGLNVQGRRNSEPIEVSEHTFGARYSLMRPDSHGYTVDDDDQHREPIVANFLVPLTGSVLGGRLVFPKINIIVDTPPGSALFWYSAFKNGRPDERIMHAHCPTVFRSKWVALKRIKLGGNMFKRQCSRIPEK